MKKKFPIFLLLWACSFVGAQDGQDRGPALPQGTGIPGLSSIPLNMSGGGYIEAGGGHSGLDNGKPSWNDAYLRTVFSGGANTFRGEADRESRYGDTGWYLSAGWIRTLSENWYTDLNVGTSTRCFFLPKFRFDGFINRKLLGRKQLVATLGGGYDRYKDIHSAYRTQVGATYYFSSPFILQGGVTFTRGVPGSTLSRSQYLAVTQGHEKEHWVSLRAEIGREAYQLIGPSTALFNFPIHDFSLTWRQWIGPNWGFNFVAEHYQDPYFHRNGGTVGIFLDF